MSRIIEPRPGVEVFPNKGGTITIQQLGELATPDSLVVVHPEYVPQLVRMLQEVAAEMPEHAEDGDDAV